MNLPAVAIFLAALACAPPASAQAKTETATVYMAMAPAELMSIVQGAGIGAVTRDGERALRIVLSNGFEMRVESTVCDTPSECFGIAITSRWSLTPEQLAAVRNALFADVARSGSVLTRYSQDGKLVLLRYLILDGGVTRANIEYELREFPKQVRKATSFLTSETSIPLSAPPG